MKALKNEKGLTLVEVLAALVILGIVFVGIMTIFPQMTLFNAKTETKLDTMNLARQEMAKITDASLWVREYDSSLSEVQGFLPVTGPDYSIEKKMESLSYIVDSSDPGTADYRRFYNTSAGIYHYIADVYTVCEPYQNPNPSAPPPTSTSCGQQDKVKLHKVHLQVLNNTVLGSGNYRVSSETFSYIPYKEIDIK